MTILVGKILTAIAATALLISGVIALTVQDLSLGSVETGQEYIATTTAASNVYGANTSSELQIKQRAGSMGSYVITGAASGIVSFYNATTSNVDLRTNNTPTSSILIANFPASTAADTYVIDSEFTTGLLMVLESGTMPTSTITYR